MKAPTRALCTVAAAASLLGILGTAAYAGDTGEATQAKAAGLVQAATLSNGYDIVNKTGATLIFIGWTQKTKTLVTDPFTYPDGFVQDPPRTIASGESGHFEIPTYEFLGVTQDYTNLWYSVGENGPQVHLIANVNFSWILGSRRFMADFSDCQDYSCSVVASEGKGTRTTFTIG